MVATNTGAWLPCGTDGKPGYATDIGVSAGPRASRGPGNTGCGWTLTYGLFAIAGSYPGRGCGGCSDTLGATCTSFSSTICEGPPGALTVGCPVGVLGICPAFATFPTPIDMSDTGGAWVVRYDDFIPAQPALGKVTLWVLVRLCYSGNTNPPGTASCNISPSPVDYGPFLEETCDPFPFPPDWCEV